jgi:hypothetical protein
MGGGRVGRNAPLLLKINRKKGVYALPASRNFGFLDMKTEK